MNHGRRRLTLPAASRARGAAPHPVRPRSVAELAGRRDEWSILPLPDFCGPAGPSCFRACATLARRTARHRRRRPRCHLANASPALRLSGIRIRRLSRSFGGHVRHRRLQGPRPPLIVAARVRVTGVESPCTPRRDRGDVPRTARALCAVDSAPPRCTTRGDQPIAGPGWSRLFQFPA